VNSLPRNSLKEHFDKLWSASENSILAQPKEPKIIYSKRHLGWLMAGSVWRATNISKVAGTAGVNAAAAHSRFLGLPGER